MGLTVSIFKRGGQSFSGGGISDTYDDAVVVNVVGPSKPSATCPAIMLVAGARGTVRCVPAEQDEYGVWIPARRDDCVGPMMGGCYVGTSDGRFAEAAEEILGHKFYGAVALHDRFETVEQYAAVSQ